MYANEEVYNEGGWEASVVTLTLAPDLVFEDHRLTGFGTLRSRQEFLDMRSSNEELFRQARIRAAPRAGITVRKLRRRVRIRGSRPGRR